MTSTLAMIAALILGVILCRLTARHNRAERHAACLTHCYCGGMLLSAHIPHVIDNYNDGMRHATRLCQPLTDTLEDDL